MCMCVCVYVCVYVCVCSLASARSVMYPNHVNETLNPLCCFFFFYFFFFFETHLWGEAVLVPCSHSTQVAGKKGGSSAGKETEDSKGQTSHTMNRPSYLYLVSQNNILPLL